MEFPKFTADLSIISKLGDHPGTDNGLSAEELKAKFDEASLLLQAYLNGTLVELLNTAFAGGDSLPVDGLNMNGAINMNRNPLQNVREPQSDHEAMNLGYAKEHFVPNERTVNGKALATDIALNAEDVGARSETWLPTIAEIGAASAESVVNTTIKDSNVRNLNCVAFSVPSGGSVRFKITAHLILIGRAISGSTTAVYVFTAYSDIRSPNTVQLSVCSGVTVAVGGDNSSGWYIEVTNTSNQGSTFYTMGNATPVFI